MPVALAVALVVVFSASPGPPAAPPLLPAPVLTPPLRARLAALPSLWGGAPGLGGLDGRAVIVTFFASWCPPCRVELEQLRQVRREFDAAHLAVVAVNLFEEFDGFSNSAQLGKFLAQARYNFPVVEGDQPTSLAFGQVRHIPSLFLFDRRGQPVLVFAQRVGATAPTLDPARLKRALRDLP